MHGVSPADIDEPIPLAVAEPSAPPASEDRLPTGRLIAHSLLHIPITGPQMPITVYLPAIYAQQYGMSLTVLGAIFLAERIWGTATDPLVGWLCDRTRSRFGRRKVWIAAGAAAFVLSSWLLFFPGAAVTPAYLTAALVALFLSLSMMQIPYYAWSGELSGNYHERTRITAYQTVTSSLALFAVLLLPTLADHFYPGNQVMKLNGMGAAIILPVLPALLLAFWAFPDRNTAPAPAAAHKLPWRQVIRAVLREKVLFRIMFADFIITFAQSIRGALFVFFVSFVAGKPEWASGLFLFQFVISIVAAPLWQVIARRIGKHRALIATELGQAVVNLSLIFVGRGDVALLLVLTVAQGLMQATGNMLLRAMLADVADEHRLRTGVDRGAMLFSVFSISGKAGIALPMGIVLPLIAWFGFDPKLAHNTPTALWAVALVFSLGPGLAHIIGAALVRGFSIDEGRLAEIRRELTARASA